MRVLLTDSTGRLITTEATDVIYNPQDNTLSIYTASDKSYIIQDIPYHSAYDILECLHNKGSIAITSYIAHNT